MAVDAARHRLRQGETAATCLWRCLGRKRKYAADDGGAWVSRRGHWIGYAAGGAQSSTRRGAVAKSFLTLIQTSSLRQPPHPSFYTRWFCCLNKSCKTNLVIPARYKVLQWSHEGREEREAVRLGILIGENRERRAAQRREHPEAFFYER